MTRIRRAFHPHPVEGGGMARIEGDEAHHLIRVLRVQPGETVGLFDGRGHEWTARVESVTRRSVDVRVEAPLAGTVDPPLGVVLYQALCRAERFEWLLQKGTEIGLAEVVPLLSERVEVRPPSPVRLARWRRIALEAAKQCGRRRVPLVHEARPLPQQAPGGAAWVLQEGAGHPPLGALLDRPAAAPVALAAGPEGGFAPAELAGMRQGGWQPASLGPRTLRAETAGVVACALVLHRWGDLGAARPI